ncbi:MAG TPA: hypothetical protein DCS93_29950 [Microscillaceae bacterium]|nr:hypothetical protein [Microscillaceae bacterium]
MNDPLDKQQDYQLRIQKVLTYIRTHLAEPLDVSQLAAIGNFSTFHFHRIIRAYLNEPLGAYIKRIRLDTAAQLLIYSQVPINEISHQIGYEVPSSFTNAFKKKFGLSPQEFRHQKQQTMQQTSPLAAPVNVHFNLSPEIIQLPDKQILTYRVLGKYESATIAQAWEKLMAYVFQHQLFSPEMEMLGISHDHPEISGEVLYHYEACVTLTTPLKSEGEFTVKTLEAGKYATFTYQGNYDQLDLIYNIILKDWLLNSTYELRDAPLFDQYLNNPGNAAPEELLTKIFIPIKTVSHAI